jgi:hypothetical protein
MGGLSGNLETGRVLDFASRPEGERKLCSLYMSLMNRMGITATEFGDASESLVGI